MVLKLKAAGKADRPLGSQPIETTAKGGKIQT
jgi:hypothetical protein